MSRNAIYQALFEARRKLAARLAADGHHGPARPASAGWLDELLGAEPGDTGCDLAFQSLDRYAKADLTGNNPQRRFPGVAAHLANCAPCQQDYRGLLASDLPGAAGSGAARD